MDFTFGIILFWLDSQNYAYLHPDLGVIFFFFNWDIIDEKHSRSLKCAILIHLYYNMIAMVVLANKTTNFLCGENS